MNGALAFDPADEWLACTIEPTYLCHKYCIIDDAQNSATGLAPFHLWDYQVTMMDLLNPSSETHQNKIIALKARQLGMSWVCCAYALWLCLFNPNKFVLIMSKGSVEASEMVSRISNLYKRLPEWLKAKCPKLVKDNMEYLEWSNGSRVMSLAATKDAGSGFTASLLILDEFAKMLFAEETYTAVKPTIDGGGQIVVISTAKGVGNTFNTLWENAEAGDSDFYPFFLPWHVRPGRDQAWYDKTLSGFSDPDKMLQEYPATPLEAFLASGRARFPFSWVKNQEEKSKGVHPVWQSKLKVPQIMPPVPMPESLRTLPDLRIYKWPEPGRSYSITCDPSQGLPESDPSPAMVFDDETWEEVALLYGRIEPTLLGTMLCNLGQWYNNAWVNVSRLNHGGTVLASMVSECYPYIVWGPDQKRGWPESPKYKPMGVDSLAVALRDDLITIRSPEFCREAKIYQVNDNGSTSAPKNKHDDMVTVGWLFTAQKNQPRPQTNAYYPGAQELARAGATYEASGYNSSRMPNIWPGSLSGLSAVPKR